MEPTRDKVTPISVLAAVVKRGDKYLVCRRPFSKRHAGLWEFPGGKLEDGETLAHAATRELREELGVAVVGLHDPLLSVSDQGSEFLIHFAPVVIEGEPHCLEHLDLRWATLNELATIQLAPSDRRFADFLLPPATATEKSDDAK